MFYRCIAIIVSFIMAFSILLLPLSCSAVDAEIEDFLSVANSRESAISLNITTENGTSINLEAYGLQSRFLEAAEEFYIGSGYNVGSTFAPSGSGYSGVYKLSGSDNLYACNLYTGSSTLASAPHFNVKLNNLNDTISLSPYQVGFWFGSTVSSSSSSWQSFEVKDTVNNYISYFSCNVNNPQNIYCRAAASGIPVVNPDRLLIQYYDLCGNGSDYTLPSGSCDSSEPWNYYNNVLLPTLIELGCDNDFIFFPNGYNTEPEQPEVNVNIPVIPVVPIVGVNVAGNLNVYAPISGQLNVDGVDIDLSDLVNGGDVIINGDPYSIPTGDIIIDGHTINFSDDDSFSFDGIPFEINPDGSITIGDTTYYYPITAPETMPAESNNYVYEYEIPTFDTFYLPDNDLDLELDSSIVSDLNSFWGFVPAVLSDFGIWDYIMACGVLCGISFVIFKVGGE